MTQAKAAPEEDFLDILFSDRPGDEMEEALVDYLGTLDPEQKANLGPQIFFTNPPDPTSEDTNS